MLRRIALITFSIWVLVGCGSAPGSAPDGGHPVADGSVPADAGTLDGGGGPDGGDSPDGGGSTPDGGSPPADAGTSPDGGSAPVSLTFDFDSGTEGWTHGFADYPDGEETFYELDFGQSALPAELGTGGGLRIAGNNHSDDLFMYVARQVTGLVPNHDYTVRIDAKIGTNAPADCLGVGGAPGASVYFKAGATTIAPSTSRAQDGSRVINIDKGNQSLGGADMSMLGHIGNQKTCPDETYEHKEFTLQNFHVDSAADGTLWVILGTDSGFEGTTTLHYDRIQVTLRGDGAN